MRLFIVQAIALTVVLAQATAQPVRLGDVARQLSEQDVAEVARAVSAGGAKSWLLNGPRGVIADLQAVEAYLPPATATRELRRGSLVSVLRGPASALALVGIRLASSKSTQRTWIVTSTGSYAQVAVPGREFAHIEGDQDINRPFVVTGSFDDGELVRLVRFVRSSPTGPPPRPGMPSGPVRGDWPILRVVRQTDWIDVRLRMEDLASQQVTLRPQGSGWVVISIAIIFA